jgi:thiol-disulfide isomerase/thioredoxin
MTRTVRQVGSSTRRAPRVPARASSRRRRATTGALTAAGVVVFVAAVLLALFARSSSAGYRTTTQGWVLPRLTTSGVVSLASFSGQPVIVNFFASWCTVCASELPVFSADAVALKGRISVVEVNALETGNGVSFVRQFHLSRHVSALARDVGGSQGDGLYQSLGGTGTMPMTAFYDANGHLITTHVGGFDSASLASAVRQIYGISLPA